MIIQDISRRAKVWSTLIILTSVQLRNSSFASFVHRFNLYSPAKWNASCFNKKRTPLARGRRGEEKTRANCRGLLGGRTCFFLFFCCFFKATRVSAFIHFAAIMFFCHPPDEMSPTNDSIYRAFGTPLQLLKVASSNFPLKKNPKDPASGSNAIFSQTGAVRFSCSVFVSRCAVCHEKSIFHLQRHYRHYKIHICFIYLLIS